jgi:hypothetical protein
MEPMKEVQIQISGGVASNVNGNPNAESNILT